MNWNFLVKRHNFSRLKNFGPHPQAARQGKYCLLMRQNQNKLVLNISADIFKIIPNLPKWEQERE